MKTKIKEVATDKDLKAFVHFPNVLYKDNPYYVPQIESMDRDTLTPGKNHAFEVCEGKYWLAYNEKDEIVGRVAGIINRQYNEKTGEKICRFGWIDFIDDREVSQALMDTVERYAKEKGLEKLCGPMGFLEFDAAGVLVEGFDKLPTAYGKYNAPYYEDHLTALGYAKDVDFVEYLIKVPEVIPERYARMAELVSVKNSLHQAVFTNRKELAPYLDGVFRCMNSAYSQLHGFSELSAGQCDDLKKQFLTNINVDYVSIILDADDQVIGFGVALPSLSKAMQKAKGSLFPMGWYHMLKALRQNDTIDLLLIAIDEKYKNKGVNAMIFHKFAQGITKNGVKFIESTRELEDNTSVQNLWRYLEHDLTKRARTYVKPLKERHYEN
ncbi:MAG: N-acetyltransferase [Bacteroidales bacterium]|nr:N-acetyltransferase [Bacteroidales bacterium]